jgi:glycosyltransferase involved in cell wall biosynthesis
MIAHPERRVRVEEYLSSNPNPKLHIEWVTLDPRFDPWHPDRGEKWIRLHYMMWLRSAFRHARRLHETLGFDVCQHVSQGTVSAPPPFWKLPIPAVWGPVGGGQTAPDGFGSFFGSGLRRQQVRDFRIRLLRFLPSLRKAARSARVCLATNHETLAILLRGGAAEARLFLDCGVLGTETVEEPAPINAGGRVTLLWAGRLESRKALPLALEAIRQAADKRLHLMVAGDGPLRHEWEELSRALNLQDQVTFCGFVPRARMTEMFRSSDAFLFTSLCDSFGSVVLEAMAYGLPIVTLDHQGIGAFVPEEAGIKVPVTTPEETIARLALALRDFSRSTAEEHRCMRSASRRLAQEQTWERKAQEVCRIYEQIVQPMAPKPA